MGIISRRSLFRAGGALVVTFAVPLEASAQGLPDAGLPPDQLDSWLAIQHDGGVIVFFGKMDPGQGVDVAIRQIVAEELDVAVERVAIVMGDSARTVNQGGASGSTGIERGGVTLRYAGAEARRVLLDLAAQHLGVAVDALQVRDGVVSVVADATRQVSYATLIGDRHFDVPMQWNGVYGNGLVARGRAEPKRPLQSIPAVRRIDGKESVVEPDGAVVGFDRRLRLAEILPDHGRLHPPPGRIQQYGGIVALVGDKPFVKRGRRFDDLSPGVFAAALVEEIVTGRGHGMDGYAGPAEIGLGPLAFALGRVPLFTHGAGVRFGPPPLPDDSATAADHGGQ